MPAAIAVAGDELVEIVQGGTSKRTSVTAISTGGAVVPAALTKVDDTNITLTLGGTPASSVLQAVSITAGFTGTLAAARLNANVVQAVTNDTNVTGSIATQTLTLGFTGTLAAARLNANVVQSVVNDTNVTGSISAQALTLGWTGTLAAARGGTGLSSLGSGVATWLGTPSSANLLAAVTDETGTGALVFATSPTLVTPLLGTPTSVTLTNATGLPIATGVSGLGAGVATFLATPTSANLAAAVTNETGSGALVFATSPGFTTAANPVSNDGAALGTTALQWSDAFLASGGVVNWNSGDVTVTHSSNALAFAGASSGYSFDALVDISGAAAGQIKFPATQNASSNANTLDDYEEGTWTPIDGSGAGLSLSGSGTYVKVGQSVTAAFNLAYPATADANTAVIAGLPFAFDAVQDGVYGACVGYSDLNATGVWMYTTSGAATTRISVQQNASLQTNAQVSAKSFRGSFSYRTSA